MLLSSPIGCAPSFLSGFGAVATASDPLKKLQSALVGLSTATRNSAINPGSVEGKLVNGLPDDRTMGAVAASMALIGPKLPTWVSMALSIALGVGATTTTAKQAVLDNANELRIAAIAATAAAPYYVKPETVSTTTTTPTVYAPAGPWFKTWWGIGAMAVGALGLISLLASRRA